MPHYQIQNCTLEVHPERGVIYVHGPRGVTLLRIEQLPVPIPDVSPGGSWNADRMLDIAHMKGCDWDGNVYYK